MVINLRLRLEYFSEDELAALGQALLKEQHRRQCLRSATHDAPSQWNAVYQRICATLPRCIDLEALPNGTMDVGSTCPVAPADDERWTSAQVVVTRNWPTCRSPWVCSECGAEWCRTRNPPPPRAAVSGVADAAPEPAIDLHWRDLAISEADTLLPQWH